MSLWTIHKDKMRTPIVTICGSTRFKEEIEKANREFTMRGAIVLAPGVFGHAGDPMTEEQKIKLDQLHKEKIKMSDFIYVVNKNGYIGSSTKSEIEFAKSLKKPIFYLENN